MPDLSAYIFFNGNCAEAMRFYERTLGGRLELTSQRDTPMGAQAPPATANLVIHARLSFPGGVLMASDWMAPRPYERMSGFRLSLAYPTATEAKQVFFALADGGRVDTPMEKTFWSEAFGMLADRFGTPWMISGPAVS